MNQNTCAVAAIRVAAAGAAMLHIFKHRKGVINSLVRFMTINISYKTSTARVVFKFWPVQALLGAFSLIHRINHTRFINVRNHEDIKLSINYKVHRYFLEFLNNCSVLSLKFNNLIKYRPIL